MLQDDKILKQKKVNVTIILIYDIINQDEKKKKNGPQCKNFTLYSSRIAVIFLELICLTQYTFKI